MEKHGYTFIRIFIAYSLVLLLCLAIYFCSHDYHAQILQDKLSEAREDQKKDSYQFVTLCAHFLTFGFSLKKTVRERGDFSRLAEPL